MFMLLYLLESMGVEYPSTTIAGRFFSVCTVQVLCTWWHLEPPFLGCRNYDLAKPGDGVASWCEVPVPWAPNKKQDQCCKGRPGRHPKS